MKFFQVPVYFFFFLLHCTLIQAQPTEKDNLHFDHLATRWDEAMPLGNGMLGALIWEKNNHLRLSLDRADLWDERKALDLSKFNFAWVVQQVHAQQYDTVQQLGDAPYDQIVYPTKLPAAAIEFDMTTWGKVISNTLDITTALNTIQFESGLIFHCYIHASRQQGYFSFEHIPGDKKFVDLLIPQLVIPAYQSAKNIPVNDNSHAGEGLQRLGYAAGTVTTTENSILYHQPTYANHYYEVRIEWKKMAAGNIIGTWTISQDHPTQLSPINNSVEPTYWDEHLLWWKNYWAQSAIHLPDSLLQKQYYLELYKLGCVARAGAPAITLQAIWTADNGSLPPWKGDFHNDLNTQLSYWPAYTSNHLSEAATFTDWLWKTMPENKTFTKNYFGVDGLNVPGVETLHGYPMGGWIQYSLSPTTTAWCAQYFYWQWQYSQDTTFLHDRAYPYLHAVAVYLEQITFLRNGKRYLPLSSSPEYNDNNLDAWFTDWTNYDLSLVKFLFSAITDVCNRMQLSNEAKHWSDISRQLPDYAINETGLSVAPGQDLEESHRHMSPYMSIYPLALLDINKPEDKPVIENSMRHLETLGTRNWCGYSFPWMACLYARAYDGEKAVKQLQIFASAFCSPNSFHLNGDQSGGHYSSLTYRPFTLEGNFAFAQGVQELLLQSRDGYIEVVPALPAGWTDVAFENLRAAGAFLISAKKIHGVVKSIQVQATANTTCTLKLPFTDFAFAGSQKKYTVHDGLLSFSLLKNEQVEIMNLQPSLKN